MNRFSSENETYRRGYVLIQADGSDMKTRHHFSCHLLKNKVSKLLSLLSVDAAVQFQVDAFRNHSHSDQLVLTGRS